MNPCAIADRCCCRQRHSSDWLNRKHRAQRRVPLTASMAWPNFHAVGGRRGRKSGGSTGCNENTQLAPSETKSLNESADGRVATGLLWAQSKNRETEARPKIRRPLPFLPDGMVTDRSSPSRV